MAAAARIPQAKLNRVRYRLDCDLDFSFIDTEDFSFDMVSALIVSKEAEQSGIQLDQELLRFSFSHSLVRFPLEEK